MTPCRIAATESARWSIVSRAMPGPERHQPARDRPGEQPQAVHRERREPGREHDRHEGQDPGVERVVQDRHLDDQAPDPRRCRGGHLERDVGAERRTADHRLVRTEVVEQGDDLVTERTHRVDERVRRSVRTPVAEQVEGHHVQPLAGQRSGERLLHPARHQLAVEQDDPVRTRAVLGVLESFGARAAVEEELPDALGDQHAQKSSRSPPPALGRWCGETGRDRDLLRHGAACGRQHRGGRAVHAVPRRRGHRLAVLRAATARRRHDVHPRRRTPRARRDRSSSAALARSSGSTRSRRRCWAAVSSAGHEAGRYPLLALPQDTDVPAPGRTRALSRR